MTDTPALPYAGVDVERWALAAALPPDRVRALLDLLVAEHRLQPSRDPYNTFLQLLVDTRKAAGVRQGVMADEMGVSQSVFSRWESGQVRPSFERFVEWASFLDVPMPSGVDFDRPARPEAACGTLGGRTRHRRNQEPLCSACKAAFAAYMKERRLRLSRDAS